MMPRAPPADAGTVLGSSRLKLCCAAGPWTIPFRRDRTRITPTPTPSTCYPPPAVSPYPWMHHHAWLTLGCPAPALLMLGTGCAPRMTCVDRLSTGEPSVRSSTSTLCRACARGRRSCMRPIRDLTRKGRCSRSGKRSVATRQCLLHSLHAHARRRIIRSRLRESIKCCCAAARCDCSLIAL